MEVGRFLQRGDLLFTKKLSKGPERGAFTVTTQTPMAVLLMGGTAGVEWSDHLLSQSLASLGLFYSDDIFECLGEDNHKKLIEHLNLKYGNKKMAAPEVVDPASSTGVVDKGETP